MRTKKLRLPVRNLLRHKLRSLMTLSAIVIGVNGLMLAGGFIQDVLHKLGESIIQSQTGHIQIFKQDYLAKGSRYPERYLIDKPDDITAAISRLPEVSQVTSRLTFSGSLNNGRRDLAIIGEGVEPAKEAQLGTYVQIIAGKPLTEQDADGVIIGEGVAASLGLQPEDHVTLLAVTGDGAINTLDLRVTGVLRSFSKDFDARAVRIQLASAQQLFATPGANLLVVSLHDTRDTDSAYGQVQGVLEKTGLEAKTWRQLSSYYDKSVELYRRQFGVLQLIILVMVLLSVSNSVNMSILERVAEFGTVRALGDRNSDTFKQVVLESATLGLVGALAGAIIAIMAAMLITRAGIPMPPPPNANAGYVAGIKLTTGLTLISISIGWTATVLASLIPAWKSAKTPIVDALRQSI